MGFVHKRNNVSQINLKSFYMRDAYMDAFTKGMNVSSFITELNLRNIGLTNSRALKLLDSLQKNIIKSLDLSYN